MPATSPIVLVGPATPSALKAWLDPRSASEVEHMVGLGGTPVNNLALGLLNFGIEVELVTLSKGLHEPTILEGRQLRIYVGPYRESARERARDLFALERSSVRRLLQRTVGQVIHAHWTYEFAMGALSDSRPLIVTIHDAPLTIFRHMPDPYRAVRTVMAARVRIGAHHFSAVSPNLAARLRRQMFIRGPIPITPNVVPTRNADDVAVRRRRWKTAPVLVDIASASKLKNVRTLLNAFKTIRTKVPGVALRLVGEGLDANADLATWSRQQDSHHGVEFLGLQTQAEIGNLLSSADLFVHASRHESFGMSVIEALGHGVPVVAGNASGALPWILQSGRAGLLVDIDDPEVIAQAAVRVLGTPSIADRLSRNGLVRAQDFSEGSVVPSYLALYEKVQRLHTQSGQRPKRSSCRCE